MTNMLFISLLTVLIFTGIIFLMGKLGIMGGLLVSLGVSAVLVLILHLSFKYHQNKTNVK